jgi:hypothetical protein
MSGVEILTEDSGVLTCCVDRVSPSNCAILFSAESSRISNAATRFWSSFSSIIRSSLSLSHGFIKRLHFDWPNKITSSTPTLSDAASSTKRCEIGLLETLAQDLRLTKYRLPYQILIKIWSTRHKCCREYVFTC